MQHIVMDDDGNIQGISDELNESLAVATSQYVRRCAGYIASKMNEWDHIDAYLLLNAMQRILYEDLPKKHRRVVTLALRQMPLVTKPAPHWEYMRIERADKRLIEYEADTLDLSTTKYINLLVRLAGNRLDQIESNLSESEE